MKIAFATDDGLTLNASVGEARYYVVVTVDDHGAELAREQRPKPYHPPHNHNDGDDDHDHHHPPKGVFKPLADCRALITAGCGAPAIRATQKMDIDLIMTRQSNINTALAHYLTGTLQNDPSLLHHD